ncbi:MAG: hypothetical protein V4450_17705 [Bacteroidota bacterium]
MKKLLLLSCMLASVLAKAQFLPDFFDVSGRQIVVNDKHTVTGSPFFDDRWASGKVSFSNGRSLLVAGMRYNLFTGQLICKVEDVEFALTDPIKEFSLNFPEDEITREYVFRSIYPDPPGVTKNQFYEVIASGTHYQLLKHNAKLIKDYYEYGSAPNKSYRPVTELFVYDVAAGNLISLSNKENPARSIPAELATLMANKKNNSEKELASLVIRLK